MRPRQRKRKEHQRSLQMRKCVTVFWCFFEETTRKVDFVVFVLQKKADNRRHKAAQREREAASGDPSQEEADKVDFILRIQWVFFVLF
jgi:hypothetical protein